MKHAALRAREGEKQLVIVTGARGGGKTHFLEFVADRLASEWGFRHGRIAGDLALYQDPAERETGDRDDFLIVDDHADEPLLACHVVEYVCQALERCNLAVISLNEDAPLLARHVREEAAKRAIEVREIKLPAPGQGRNGRGSGTPAPRFLDALSGEERSVLGFLAVFGFEVPLSFLLGIFAPEENGIYAALQNLVARGLVKSRAETSSLSGDDHRDRVLAGERLGGAGGPSKPAGGKERNRSTGASRASSRRSATPLRSIPSSISSGAARERRPRSRASRYSDPS